MAAMIVCVVVFFLVALFLAPVVFCASIHGKSILLKVYVLGIRVFYVQGESWQEVISKLKRLVPKKKPKKKNAKKQKQNEAEETEKTKKEKRKKELSVAEVVELIRRLALSVNGFMRMLLRFVWFYDVEVVVPVSGADASDVAQEFGKTHALLGGARAALSNLLHLRFKKIVVIPNFAQNPIQAEFALKVAMSPFTLLLAAGYAVWRFARENPAVAQKKRRRALKKRMKKIQKNRQRVQKKANKK